MSATSIIHIPQDEGVLSPAEAQAFTKAAILESNRAGDLDVAAQALKTATNITQEWTEKMRGLHRRWRATWHMLSGNTLERSGPEDVHVPEIYKAIETVVPRAEEMVIGEEPWFEVVPKKRADRRTADAIAAFIDWQNSQNNTRALIQPAIRDMIVTQVAVFYSYWENRVTMRNVRTPEKKWVNGKLVRKVKVERKEVVDFSGVRTRLVDPIDFIIDTKSTNPQDAQFVGHRAWLTKEQIKAIGKDMGWMNLDKLDEETSQSTLGMPMDFYAWPRDPAARYGVRGGEQDHKQDNRSSKMEVVFLYVRASFDGGPVQDWRIAIAAGRVALEVRPNPHDGQFRPYACMRVTKSGHEFFGIGPFDNAIRLSQHLDRYWQITMRGASIAGQPMVFAEEDSELPDSLYRVSPGKVYKGVGNVRFTQIPDGFLRSMPLVIQMMQRNIEETTGSFRINMGQDSGGTATEASLSLQEGNRRMRGIVRSIGDGLEALLEVQYKLTLQNSSEDVEFPVLGKRAIDMKRTHLMIGPADFLDDVKFEMVGLRNSRNYGLKSTGLQAFTNAMTPFIMANPQAVDQVGLMHEFAREMIGPEEANRIVKVPTPLDSLYSQEEENEGLIQGEEMPVDPDDDDEDHLQKIKPLFDRAVDMKSEMHDGVRRAIIQHALQHELQLKNKKAREKAQQARSPQQIGIMPPEAGGQAGSGGGASPKAGGFSDAVTQLANEPGGQTPNENPGPADQGKYSRSGRASRTTNQSENG